VALLAKDVIMRFFGGLAALPADSGGCVATLGNFDGVHLGHQRLFQQLTEIASQHALPSCVLTFEPSPKDFFQPQPPPKLMRLRQKVAAIQACGIEQLWCLRFNALLAKMPAADFVTEILVKKLKVKHLLIGHDFRFGYQRIGSLALLRELGRQYHFQTSELAPVIDQGQRISSSLIRQALAADQLSKATAWLGRPYQYAARVIQGAQRGRLLGFPTANLITRGFRLPLHGVFYVQVQTQAQTWYAGVANLGQRPTVNGQSFSVEVHLLDFSGNLYGQYVTLNFIAKLRDEQKFASLDALQQQIGQDIAKARAIFELS
jgi:riboflavin kinase/FMN adenylyltransferase